MDINGTEQADRYDQSTQAPGDWHNYHGKGGNDTIRMYNGTAIGGAGADTIEHLASADWWRSMQVAYWDSPAGIVANLAAGWVDDGWGSRDTLVGTFSTVHGNWHDDQFTGDALDNQFWPNGGHDAIDGGAGLDTVGMAWQAGDPPKLGNYTVVVSTDARHATITSKTDQNLRYELTDIERLNYWDGTNTQSLDLADFIDPNTLAQQGLTGANPQRWNASSAVGTAVSVSYSFVELAPASGTGSDGFRSFSAAERQTVRSLLSSTSALTGLSFTEVNELSGASGQIRFGVSAQSNTKGVAAMPDGSATNTAAGDIWMDVESMLALTPGTEAYAALLHELGHALGLRHPRNVDAGDAWTQQFRAADDKTSLTAMSGTTSGDGLFRADWGPLDIAALQYLYGSKSTNAGDTVYRVGGTDAQAQRTLIDSGGTDTMDASGSQAGVSIDLIAAHLSSVGLTSQGLTPVENLAIALGTAIENAIGSDHDDVLLGNALTNLLEGRAGNDWIDGGAGQDSAVFAGPRADYFISTGFGKVFVAARDGSSGFDTLQNIERLSFADRELGLGASALASDLTLTMDQGNLAQGNLPDPSDQARTAVSYSKSTDPAHGSVSIDASGGYRYTPSAFFVGNDVFSYQVSDSAGGVNTYSAYISVVPASDVATTPLNLNGTDAADTLLGSTANDTLNGAAGNDQITGRGGNDSIDGGSGLDTAHYSGSRANYTLSPSGGGFSLADGSGMDGSDSLRNVERLAFADRGVALDLGLDQSGGQAALLIGAILGQSALAAKPALVAAVIGLFDQGLSLQTLSGAVMRLPIWGILANGGAASASNSQIASYLLSTVNHAAPDANALSAAVSALDAETGASQGTFLWHLAESAANQAQVGLVGLAQTGLEFGGS